MYRFLAISLSSLVTIVTADSSNLAYVQEREMQPQPSVVKAFADNNNLYVPTGEAVLPEKTAGPATILADTTVLASTGGAKVLTTLTLLPAPSPNFLAASLAGLLWLMVFCTGFCALFALETPTKFVEKGLMMNKEN